MKKEILIAILAATIATARAVEIVDFDADDIASVLSFSADFPFNASTSTLNASASPGYAGQPLHGAFVEEGSSVWSANNRQNAGLKLRWNGGAGIDGEASSGLYLFKQADFLNGLDAETVEMTAAHDTVSGEAGFIHAGDGPGDPAVSSTTIRFVLQDDAGWHISNAEPLVSNTSFAFDALALSYSTFDPTVDTSTEAGTIGGPSSPSFKGVVWVGFRIDATRGSRTSQGVNIGVEWFRVEAAAPARPTVIDAGDRKQKMEGFGASGAYFQNRLINHDDSAELADLLFADLGLDLFRIRNVYLQSGYVNDVQVFRDTIALGEAAAGRPLKVLMSAWTPPAELKSTGSEAGSNDATLASDGGGYRYDDYADWWADALDYYASNDIQPEFISMQNEPNWHPDYDGCGFEPIETTNFAGYNLAFDAVWTELAQRHGTMNMPKMVGPEPIGINRLDEYIDALNHPDRMYAYAHHLYQSNPAQNPDALNAEMAATRDAFGYKPLFQTEYAYLNGNTNSPLRRKLDYAKLMHNALTIEEVSAYFYWALYWTDTGEQGLVRIPNDPSAPYSINAEYYAFKHFSAFVHADWRRVAVDADGSGLSVSAFASPNRDALSVMVVNEGESAVDWEPVFSNGVVTAGTIHRTSAGLDCAEIGAYAPGTPLEIPAESITTLALELAPESAPTVTNILMIAIDDLRPQTRSYGAAQMITPHLDQLAADGFQFNRAYVQQAVCSPSRASVMTGMRPDSTKVYDLVTDFRDAIPWVDTLSQWLIRHGYHSAAIGKIYHGGLNDEQSWSEPWISGSGSYGSIGPGNPPTERTNVVDNVYRDGAVTDEAILKLADLKTKQPFFYGVGYVRPHLPFVAPEAYWALYDEEDLELPHTDQPAVDASTYAYTTWGELRNYDGIPESGPVSAEQEKELIHGYYASVSYMDAQLGRLMDALEAEGLAENTIVLVWGDHGWHLGDHGQWCKHTNFERATRIPLIVKVPWMPGAERIDALAEAVDIYPTLLDLCGVPAPDYLEGESLVPLMENPAMEAADPALSQYPRSGNMGYSMRTDRYRYTEWRVENSNLIIDRELYDQFLDPLEDTNVVDHAEYAADVAALAIQLEDLLTELNPPDAGGGERLIVNGEFDDGLNGWSLTENGTADANFTVLPTDGSNGLGDDPLLHMEISDGTADKYRLAIERIVPARSGRTYTLRFAARAAGDRNITFLWRNKNNVGSAYLSLNAPITTESRAYAFSGIQLSNLAGTDPDGEVRVQFGGSDHDVWIDSIEIVAETTFAAALAEAGLTGPDALLDADADGDTVPNLYEYAYNLDMTTNDYHVLAAGTGTGTSGLPTHRVAPTNAHAALELEFVRRRGAGDLEYAAEFNGDLQAGAWTNGLAETAAIIDADWERVVARDAETTETATNRFGRVRVRFTP